MTLASQAPTRRGIATRGTMSTTGAQRFANPLHPWRCMLKLGAHGLILDILRAPLKMLGGSHV